MSKEQTPIEIIKVMIENGVEITVDHVTKLLTKEKEQREELIKGVYADALIDQSIFDCGDINKQELSTIKEKAEQYYNEVFKNYPKQ
jgi:hypothetical protein